MKTKTKPFFVKLLMLVLLLTLSLPLPGQIISNPDPVITEPHGTHCDNVTNFCTTQPVVEKDGVQRFLEVAVDVDISFFNRYRNTGSSQNPVENVTAVVMDRINAASAIYERYFDLQFKVVHLNIWQAPSDEYPYEGDTLLELWAEARNYWNQDECVHRDLFLLFTAHEDISNCGVVSGIGVGSLCNASFNTNSNIPLNAYAVIQDFGERSYQTVAHEIGHLFGLDHIPANACNGICVNASSPLMCGACLDTREDRIIATNQCNIYAFLQNEDCFTDCGPLAGEPPAMQGPDIICVDAEETYSINVSGSGTIEWILGPNLDLIAGDLNSPTIKVRVTAPGNSFIQVEYEYNCRQAAIRKNLNLVSFEIRELDPMCSSEYCAIFERDGTYALYDPCEDEFLPACWAFSRPNDFYPNATQQNPFCANTLVAFPIGNLDNPTVTLYAYDAADPTRLLAQRNLFIPDCEWPCVSGRSKLQSGQTTDGFSAERFAIPNPANDLLTLYLPQQEAQLEVAVFDIHGRAIYTEKINTSQATFQLVTEQWPTGFYLIQIKTASNRYVQSLIIQH